MAIFIDFDNNATNGIPMPALKNRFVVELIEKNGNATCNEILTTQAIKARMQMGSGINKLKLEIEADYKGLVAERVAQLNVTEYDILLRVLDGHETTSYIEHFSNCAMSMTSWDYNYASSETVKYLIEFTFDEYSTDRSYWLRDSDDSED